MQPLLLLQVTIAMLFFGLWCCYAVIEGWREGEYLHARIMSDNEIGRDEGRKIHLIWWLQRSILVVGILYARFTPDIFPDKLLHALVTLISLALVFPFLHDGNMYATRNNLNPKNYPERWLAQSTTSTARTTSFWNPAMRLTGLFLGCTAFITDVVMLFM